jgi:hypothetical protein
MGKAVVFIIIFFILVGGLAFLYFHFEKPAQKADVVQYTNLTIFSDDNQGDLIHTVYLIYVNGSLYAGGETDRLGGVKELVTTNNEFVLKNVNLQNQSFYTEEIKFSSPIPNKVSRIDFQLDKLGILDIAKKGNFGADNKITLILSTDDAFRNLLYCLKWSEMLVAVQSPNDNLISDIYDDNYKCYKTNSDVTQSKNYTITINYNAIGALTPTDYIRLDFYDNDKNLNQTFTKRQEYFIK